MKRIGTGADWQPWPDPPDDEGMIQVRGLSFITPEEISSLFNGKMPSEALAAIVHPGKSPEEGKPIPVECVGANLAFVDLLHEVVRVAGPANPYLVTWAAEQGEGRIYVVAGRSYAGFPDNIPTEDIIGAFEVRSGQIVAGSYRPNDDFRVYTASGLAVLLPSLRKAFVAELVRRAGQA